MFGIKISYADGTFAHEATGIARLDEATRFALQIADDLGSANRADTEEAQLVAVERDGFVEIAIRVIKGGLLSS